MPIGQVGPNSSGAVEVSVLSEAVTLTDAQIKALPNGAAHEGVFQLLPPLGANKIYDFISATVVADFSAGIYGNISATSQLVIVLGPSIADFLNVSAIIDEAVGTGVTQLLGGLFKHYGRWPKEGFVASNQVQAIMNTPLDSTMINQPMQLYCFNDVGNFTGGHASNYMRISILYTIIDV